MVMKQVLLNTWSVALRTAFGYQEKRLANPVRSVCFPMGFPWIIQRHIVRKWI